MKKLTHTLLLTAVSLCSYTICAQTILHVSPSGSGDNFTAKRPGNINDIAKLLREPGKREGGTTVVIFSGGEYYLSEPIKITNNTVNDTLVLTGIEGQKAIISGGRKITGWKSTGNGIYKAEVPGEGEFRQLYVDGKMAVRARTPNRTNEADFSPYFRMAGFDENNKTVFVNSSDMPRWEEGTPVELVINQHWYQSRMLIDSFGKEGDSVRITPKEPARKHLFMLTYARMLTEGRACYFENALEFLDNDHEWYFDRKERTLYYKPDNNRDINKLEVIYPLLDAVIDIKGSEDKPVHNVVIRNLEIAHSNWTIPGRDGIIATQGVQGRGYTGEMETGIIQVDLARNISIEHCNIKGAGDNGILFFKGVQDSRVVFNHIDQISANGIQIDTYRKAFPGAKLICKNNLIADNLIENVGLHYTSGMGIIVSCVEKTKIEYNEIRFGRYTGMQIGNHYGDNLNGMRDNIIKRNNIHHVMQLHDDGGAIYTLSVQPGTRIAENWIHDFGRSEWADNFPVNGVFLDNSSAYILVRDNVFSRLTGVDRIKEQHAGDAETRGNMLINNNTQNSEVKQYSGVRATPGVKTSEK